MTGTEVQESHPGQRDTISAGPECHQTVAMERLVKGIQRAQSDEERKWARVSTGVGRRDPGREGQRPHQAGLQRSWPGAQLSLTGQWRSLGSLSS